MDSYEIFFYYVGLLCSANFLLLLIRNCSHWVKNKTFIQNETDFEIKYLKDTNKLLESRIESQDREIEKLAELIYSNK